MTPPKRWLLVSAVAAVALFSFGLRFIRSDSLTSPVVVMAPIANGTGDPVLEGITDMLRQQLTQSTFMTVLRSRIECAAAPEP